MWLYGSGFPKSMALDKSIEAKLTTGNANKTEFHKLSGVQEDKHHYGFTTANKEHGIRPKDYTTEGASNQYLKELEPTTELAKQWEGWGTQLKPSYEPVIVARKPVDESIVENVIAYNVGGINIDECRIEHNEPVKITKRKGIHNYGDNNWNFDTTKNNLASPSPKGRFPANTILTYNEEDENEIIGGFPNTTGSVVKEKGTYGYCFDTEARDSKPMADGYNDKGSASRYFKNCEYNEKDEEIRRYYYCAKATSKDRDEGLDEFKAYEVELVGQLPDGFVSSYGNVRNKPLPKRNIHPTVKPTELMQYLVRLVTPKGGTVLDPFNGSGSTGKAVAFENRERDANYKYIGIELSEEYCNISKARIQWASNEYVYINNEEVSKEDIEEIKKENNKSKGIRLW